MRRRRAAVAAAASRPDILPDIVGKKWRKVGKTGKSGEKWEKSGEMFSQNGRRRPFWMTENHFRSHFSPFQINAQLLIFFLQNDSRSVINGCVIYEFDTCIGVAVT